MHIRYTLVTDGISDRALIPIINWALDRYENLSYVPQFPQQNHLPPIRDGLTARASHAVQIFPCDILFVHRDAERESLPIRTYEVESQVIGIHGNIVPVVPIRMTEAWLLSSEDAIRAAAGNPNGNAPLNLPQLTRLESMPDPKEALFASLRTASELGARRLRSFDAGRARARVAELTEDFSALTTLSGFSQFMDRLNSAVDKLSAE